MRVIGKAIEETWLAWGQERPLHQIGSLTPKWRAETHNDHHNEATRWTLCGYATMAFLLTCFPLMIDVSWVFGMDVMKPRQEDLNELIIRGWVR